MTKEEYNKLDKCYFHYSIDDHCKQELVDARSLLSELRFDFYGILLYIDHKVKGIDDLSLAMKVYLERTRAMTGFKLSEIGNDAKTSFDDFVAVLDQLIVDFQNGQYDYERTLIPVDANNEPIDGAHRVCCAAYFGKKIKVLRFLDKKIDNYDYQYLNDNFLPADIADMMALEALNWHNDIYALFFWPKAFLYQDVLCRSLDNLRSNYKVLYEREYKLNYQAIVNLMIQLYGHMDWVGSVKDGFPNITYKADEVWAKNGLLKIVLVRAACAEDILELKKKIRDDFGIGLASVHSTDNMQETKMAMNALLNPNSRHFLMNALPTKFKRSLEILEKFKGVLKAKGENLETYLVDSSMILDMYGIRPANDLDYLSLSNTLLSKENGLFENHEDTVGFHLKTKQDLILNPINYFVFNGIKFLTLDNLLIYKQERFKKWGDDKDKDDIKLISLSITPKSKIKEYFSGKYLEYKRKKRLLKEKVRFIVIKTTQKMHLYSFLRRLKHWVKG